jgi:hypothetical protein
LLRLLTAACGTSRTCRHVCSSVAFGGKADSRLCALPEPNDVVDRAPLDDLNDMSGGGVETNAGASRGEVMVEW